MGKYSLFCHLALYLFSTFQGLGQISQEWQKGKLVFKKTYHNFGKVKRGQVLTHRFEFTNLGPGSLTITGTHSDCGCSVVSVTGGPKIAPEQKGSITVQLQTHSFVGRISKALTVLSSVDRLPRKLTLTAEVIPEFLAHPPLLEPPDRSTLDHSSQKRWVTLVPQQGFPLLIKKIRYNRSLFFLTAKQEGHNWRIEILFRKKDIPANEKIWLSTNSLHLPEMMIPIHHPQQTTPFQSHYIEFGAVQQGRTVQRELLIDGDIPIIDYSSELFVNGVRLDQSELFIKAQIQEHESEPLHKLTVSLKSAAAIQGSLYGHLLLKTTDSKQPLVRVRFFGMFL